MPQNVEKIYSLPENLYSEGSPIIICEGGLFKVNATNALTAKLCFLNISDKEIKFLKVTLTCLDSMMSPVGGKVDYEYALMPVSRGDEFGGATTIKIPIPTAKAFSLTVSEVGFADNTLWLYGGGEWESVPRQARLDSTIFDEYALRGYRSLYGEGAEYAPAKYKDIWLCACGAVNSSDDERCYRCNSAYSEMSSFDVNELHDKGVFSAAAELYDKGDLESLTEAKDMFASIGGIKGSGDLVRDCQEKIANVIDEENRKNEKIARRKKKIIFASAFSALAVAFFVAIGYFVAYPWIAYSNGDYSVYINMYNVKELEIKEGTKEIKPGAFADYDNLISVKIPDSVTSIGNSAFSGCESLSSVVIGNGVTSIGDYAFRDCTSLSSVVISGSVTSIGSYAFYNCESLNSVVIPDSVTSIGDYAFLGCTISSVEIGDSVTSIGRSAFSGCTISSVVISDSVTSIGDYAFSGWTNLSSVVISDSVTSIGDYAFRDCTSLRSVVIGDNVTSVGHGAFQGCTSLSSVVIPDSVTSISFYAFEGCTSLRDVYYTGSAEEWAEINISKWNSPLQNATKHYNYVPK